MSPRPVLVALFLMATPALAERKTAAQLPQTQNLSQPEARALLTQLAQVNVITSNCPAYPLSDADWMLVTGTSDRIAAQLGLDAATYDKEVYAPAFSVLDEPGACERIGPTAAPLVARLKAMVPAD